MAGHAQLKFVLTECSKTQIRLTGLIWLTIFSNIAKVNKDGERWHYLVRARFEQKMPRYDQPWELFKRLEYYDIHKYMYM